MVSAKNLGKRGQNAGVVFVGIIVVIVLVIIFLPYISADLGIFSTAGTPPPVTQGVVVSSVGYTSSVSPNTQFDVSFTISNNIDGKGATSIDLCMDNLGLFTIASSPNQPSSGPQECVDIPTLFAGGSVLEVFRLASPTNGEYENIPYVQEIGYYINYSYAASASQSLEFASEQAYSSRNYPVPSFSSYGNTAGPVSIETSAQLPAVYGTAAEVSLGLDNVGTGIVLGPVDINITMNSSEINMTQGLPGFTSHQYANGTVRFSGSLSVGQGTTTATLPIALSSKEDSALSAGNIPYFLSNMQVSISYSYLENGFFRVALKVESYTTS